MKRTNKMSEDRRLMDQLTPDPSLGRLLGMLATTYELQPEFFETDFLPTLLGLGAWDDRSWTSRIALEKQLAELDAAAVLLDARPYRGRPRSLRVEVTPVPLNGGRILHAKVLLGVYEEAIRLIVGSANLTEPGYRRNREVVAVLTASARRSAEARLIAQGICQMDGLVQSWLTPSVRQLRQFALERLEEWSAKEVGCEEWFVWGGGEQPLWQQFFHHWPSMEHVERITVVSPFWSEEIDNGPITAFVTALRDTNCLAEKPDLLLLTEAAPDRQITYMPRLPASFANFDAGLLGVNAKAVAVDPRVSPEEVGLGAEFTGTRSLHAKVVLLEGQTTSLAFLGSANFTRHGWGFLANPHAANIEAGLIVRRSGDDRGVLNRLIPATTGDPVLLAGAATGQIAVPEAMPDEPPWPWFLREVLLAPSENQGHKLDLVVHVTEDAVGTWCISHLPGDDQRCQPLLKMDEATPEVGTFQIVLEDETLSRLLREQEVHVEWWLCPEGRSYPINVAESARTSLPISPGSGRPDEQHLIAFYQGRITWEDLFPDPEGRATTTPVGLDVDDQEGVDTSRIQSYIVREFVEALKGISDDLKAAARSSKSCMRLALVGPVSPVALARRVLEAANAGERTPTASGFQLVEILGCLDAARHFEATNRFRDDWNHLIGEAATEIAGMLESIQVRFPDQLSREFRRYAQALRRHHLKQSSPA